MSRIGLAVAHDAVRAVMVRHGSITWAAEVDREPGKDLPSQLDAVLKKAPRGRLRRCRVAAAVGPHAAQVKQVAGLPSGVGPETLAAVIRESASSFFLRNGVPLIITGVRPVADGIAWAAAFETPVVEAIREACAAARMRLVGVVPGAVVLPSALEGDTLTWRDGPVAVEIERSAGGLESVRPKPSALCPADDAPPRTVAALGALGEEAWRFADAYGAALLGEGEVLSLGPRGSPVRATRSHLQVVRVPALMAGVALASFLLSPLASTWSARRAEATLRDLHASERWQVMEKVTSDLRPVAAALEEIDAFTRSRPDRSRLIGALARALPAGSALLGFEVAGREATVVALASQGDAVADALRGIPGVRSVELVDGMGPQAGPAQPLHRIAIRLRLSDPANAARPD